MMSHIVYGMIMNFKDFSANYHSSTCVQLTITCDSSVDKFEVDISSSAFLQFQDYKRCKCSIIPQNCKLKTIIL